MSEVNTRLNGVIAQFWSSRQFGFIDTDIERAFCHLMAFRADSIGRRFPYAKIGQTVTFTPFVQRGQLQAHDIAPVEPMPVIDPHHHREISRIVFVSDAGDFAFLERESGDQLYFRVPSALATHLSVGCMVEHSVFRDGRKFRAKRLKIVSSAQELTWPPLNCRPLHSI